MNLSHMYGLSKLYDIAIILRLPRSEVSCVFTTLFSRFLNLYLLKGLSL